MNGSGARDGSLPPWGPADPVPGAADMQKVRGLGDAADAGPRAQPGPAPDRLAGDRGARTESGPGGPDGKTQAAPDGPEEPDGPAGGRRRRSFWRELPVLIVIALIVALVIKSFVVQAFYIPSGSMQNTLAIGDRVLINKVVYHLRSIHRGDIVVFDGSGSWDFNTPAASPNILARAADELEGIVGISHDTSIYVKRVIGLPGDRVVCCNARHQLTVNGVPLSESSYLLPGDAPSATNFSVTVPPGRLWVMGDDRAISYDSRGHLGDPGGGTIPESAVLGRAFVIIWPLSRVGSLDIPATFEQPQLNASSAAGAGTAANAGAAGGGSSTAGDAARAGGTPVQSAASPLPLALGFAGAVPLTWLQRRARQRGWLSRRYRGRPARRTGPAA